MNQKIWNYLLPFMVIVFFSSCSQRRYTHRSFINVSKQVSVKDQKQKRKELALISSRKGPYTPLTHQPALPIEIESPKLINHRTDTVVRMNLERTVVTPTASKPLFERKVAQEPSKISFEDLWAVLFVLGMVAVIIGLGSLFTILSTGGIILASIGIVSWGLLAGITGLFLHLSKSKEKRERNAIWQLVGALLFLSLAIGAFISGLIVIAFGAPLLSVIYFLLTMLFLWFVALSIKGFASWRKG